MKKGEITLRILEFLEEAAGEFEDILLTYLNTGYKAGLGKSQHEKDKTRRQGIKRRFKRGIERETRDKCAKVVSYLKKDGLIEEKQKGLFKITGKGKRKKQKLKEKLLKSLPSVDYEKKKGNQLIIVAFDIPENQRRKRDWLRKVLQFLDYKMIQKSVWMGTVLIPKELMDDLNGIGLIDAVEIIAVSKKGTLSKIQ